MAKLHTAIWQIDTFKKAGSVADRFEKLIKAVDKAWAKMSAAASGEDVRNLRKPSEKDPIKPTEKVHKANETKDQFLFVAPEYLFTAKDSHFMDEQSCEMLRAQLVFLSLRYPDLLLIPGSAGWFKTNQRAAAKLFRKKVEPKDYAKKSKRDMGKYVGRLEKELGRELDYETAMGKENMYLYKNAHEDKDFNIEYSLKEFADKLKESGDEIRIVKNTCFVLHQAGIIHKYDKSFEAASGMGYDEDIEKIDLKRPTLFMPGKHNPAFTHGGVSYGLELCADHNSAALALYSKTIKPTDIDVQIVMSASTELEDKHQVASKYVIQADASFGLVLDAEGSTVDGSEDGDLKLYSLDL